MAFQLPCTVGFGCFGVLELETDLTKLAQYASTLLHPQHTQVEELQVAPRRFLGKKRPHCGAFVAAVEGTDNSTISSQRKPAKKLDHEATQGFGTENN